MTKAEKAGGIFVAAHFFAYFATGFAFYAFHEHGMMTSILY
ncbi:hypothetical protein [Lysinibacillus yapensis]|nr:hypothetical protein [Lysinibacillus yapensis]